MKHDWPLRQLLAVLRGVGLMLALLLALVFAQLAPSVIHGGLAGVHDHIVRVATSGVPPQRWGVAIARMYEALATSAASCSGHNAAWAGGSLPLAVQWMCQPRGLRDSS